MVKKETIGKRSLLWYQKKYESFFLKKKAMKKAFFRNLVVEPKTLCFYKGKSWFDQIKDLNNILSVDITIKTWKVFSNLNNNNMCYQDYQGSQKVLLLQILKLFSLIYL